MPSKDLYLYTYLLMGREQVQIPWAPWILKLPVSAALCSLLLSFSTVSSPPAPTLQARAKKMFSHKDKRIVIIIGYHPPGVPALQQHFCGSLWAAGKCWARDLGFHSQQYTPPGTETFPLISFIYSWTPLSPLTRFLGPLFHSQYRSCRAPFFYFVCFIFPNSNILVNN